jgi:hypothetical protein
MYTFNCCTVAFRSTVHCAQISFFRFSLRRTGRPTDRHEEVGREKEDLERSDTRVAFLYVHPVSQGRWHRKHFLWRATLFLPHFSLPQTRGGVHRTWAWFTRLDPRRLIIIVDHSPVRSDRKPVEDCAPLTWVIVGEEQ